MYDEKIKKYLYNEEYDLLIQEVDREIENNSFEASFYYYRFLAKNKDYSHMDFNNLIDKEDYDRAMELDFMHTFDTEFKFFKILNNEERKLFQYANHMNEEKLNEAIQSFDVSNSNTFNTRDEARALSEYANTLNENKQKELTGKLLLFYIEDRTWDPSLRSVKDILEEVLLLFESSLFHKIERSGVKRGSVVEDIPLDTPIEQEPISDTEAVSNLNEDKEETKTVSKQENTNVEVESKKNVTVIPPEDNSTVGNSKRMYSNGSTYIRDNSPLEQTEGGNRGKLEIDVRRKRLFIKTFVGILIFILAIIIGIITVVNIKPYNEDSSSQNKETLKISSSGFGLAGNTAIIPLCCPYTYNGKSIDRVDGTVYLQFKNSECGGSAYCSVTPIPSNFNISMNSTISSNDFMNGYSITFTVYYIYYSDGTIDTYSDLITIS